MKRSTIVAAVVATAVIGGGAAAGAAMTGGGPSVSPAAQDLRPAGDDRDDDHEDRDDDHDDDRDDRDDHKGAAVVGGGAVQQVIATALAAAPGHVVEVDLDDDGSRHWEVEIAGDDDREHELEISLDGATVLSHERDGDDDDLREARALLKNAAVRAADAARIAEERFGGPVHEVDLDTDDRVWDVELRDAAGDGWELQIDVHTGQIRDVEQDGS